MRHNLPPFHVVYISVIVFPPPPQAEGLLFFLILLSAVWWMRPSKRLVQASWWRDLWWVELGVALVSRAQQNFNLLVCCWVGLCSLPVGCLAWGDPALEPTGYLAGLIIDSGKAHAKEYFPELLLPVSLSPWCVIATPASARDPLTLAGRSGSVPYGVTASSPGAWCAQDFVCALQEWNICFPQSCQSPVIKSCWPSKSDSLRIPPPIARPPSWETWRGAWNLHSSGWTSMV